MVQISQKIFALDEIFDLNFDKFPLASFYNDYPFLIIKNFFTKQECDDVIKSLNKNEDYKAKLISKESLNENIRKTILHKPTDKIRDMFENKINLFKKEIESFFGVSLFRGTDIQILEYKEKGHYNCHSDNSSILIQNGKIVGFKKVAPQRKLTTLLFLNSNFTGGEIEFCYLRYYNNKKVVLKPEEGMMIVFPSNPLFSHKVMEVKKGQRYAIVKWWDVI